MKTKNIIYIVAALSAVMGFSGCSKPQTATYAEGHRVVTIEGCEYFKLYGYGIDCFTLSHKGNCTNSIHVYNKP